MRPFMQHERCAPRAAAQPMPSAGWLAALVLALLSPAVVTAQDSTCAAPDSAVAAPTPTSTGVTSDSVAGPTHTVRKGDTLWELANFYLSDPFLWPEIYRMNTAVVEDPHWIYPGELLHVPGTARLAAADELMPRLRPQPVASSGGPTVFSVATERRLESSRLAATAANYSHTAVRAGDFYAAPWVERAGTERREGRIVQSTVLAGIAQASDRARLAVQERVYITLPEGTVASPGDRFVALEEGPELRDDKQVVVPTGIVEVERAGNGDAPTARVIRMFGDMQIGQDIAPLEHFSMDPADRPEPLMLGTECKVIAVPSTVVLPTIGYYVILSATAADGVQVGDQFTLYRPRTSVSVPGEGTRSVTLPEEEIALAQVVRVTDLATTALVTSQRHPVIKTGVNARLTARMP